MFLSSHLLAEVARLATRIGILHHGRLIGEHDADHLDRHRRRHVRLATRDDHAACAVLRAHGYRPELGPAGLLLTDSRALPAVGRMPQALARLRTPSRARPGRSGGTAR
ncbi:hypothetical protein AB0L53_55410 [Nonomuraea sp. NPDC052129]|uniref:hypothetical protein n=1 Tax=Nonomuraea sp. NPDC052129 TaxID=3154651 RepID=UPI00343E49D3